MASEWLKDIPERNLHGSDSSNHRMQNIRYALAVLMVAIGCDGYESRARAVDREARCRHPACESPFAADRTMRDGFANEQ